jgi:hypothetical protein
VSGKVAAQRAFPGRLEARSVRRLMILSYSSVLRAFSFMVSFYRKAALI